MTTVCSSPPPTSPYRRSNVRQLLDGRPALCPEIARDRACGLADCGRECGLACLAGQPFRRARDADAADDCAEPAEDRRGNSDLAQHRFLALEGVAARPDLVELMAECRVG